MVWQTLAVQGGPWALISLGVVSIFRGWLIPRSSHLREIGYVERASNAKDATIAEQKEQIKTLLGSRDKVGPVS